MRKLLMVTIVALALPFFGLAAQAATTHHHHRQPAPAHRAWVPTGHQWRNWGGSPYATAATVFSAAKVDNFFVDAQNPLTGHPMPDAVVAAFKKLIHDHPKGSPTYLTAGVTVPLMESGDGPMFQVPVDRLPVSFGIDKSAEVVAWALRDSNGWVWEIGFPVRCHNWSVFKVEIPLAPPPLVIQPAPAPRKAPCTALHIIGHGTDQVQVRDTALTDLVPDVCGPSLQLPGQSFVPGNLPNERLCQMDEDCSFDGPERAVQNLTRLPMTVRPFPVINLTLPVSGDYVLSAGQQVVVIREHHHWTICFKTRVWSDPRHWHWVQGKPIIVYPTSFVLNPRTGMLEEYILLEPSDPAELKQVPADWPGKPHLADFEEGDQ